MFESFKEIKVIELASILAGPLVGTFFSELGAEVIKVENKTSDGDATRQWKEESEVDSPVSAYYAAANFGKKSILLDLKDHEDYNQFISLLNRADIVISNFSPKTASNLKVDFPTLTKYIPNLIYAQLYAYDRETEKPGYDIIMQAECGYLSMCGDNNIVAKIPVALIDVLAAHQMKEALLIALLKRNTKPNDPQFLEISLYKTAIASLANQASNFLMNGNIPKRLGTKHPNIAPYGDIYETKDRKRLILAIGSDSQFAKLIKILNRDGIELNNFMLNRDRVADREGLNEFLQSCINAFESNDLEEIFRRKQIPYCFIHDLSEVFTHPLALEMIRSEEIEGRVVYGVKTIAFTC